MSLSKIKEIRDFSIQEIDKKIEELKIEIIKLRIQISARENVQPHMFKHKKHQLAQLLTIKTQKMKPSIK